MGHVDYILLRYIRINQNQMVGGNIKGIREFFIRLNGQEILRQARAHVIIDIHVVVAIESRDAQHDCQYAKCFVMLHDETADVRHARQERLMRSLGNQRIHHADDAREQRHRAQHAEDNALAHNDAEIAAERETHKANRDEARNRRQAAADNRGERLPDCCCHGFIAVAAKRLLLFIAVPEENGVIQRNSQLKHRRDSLRDVRNLTHEVIAAHVPENGNADAAEENQRKQERIHRQHQHDAAKRNRNGNVNAFLLLDQRLGIGNDGGKTRNEALLPRNPADVGDGFHRSLCGGRVIEENGDDAILSVFKTFAHIIRQYFGGNGSVQRGSIADHRIYMRNLTNGFLQIGLLDFV